jgi:histone H3/H4
VVIVKSAVKEFVHSFMPKGNVSSDFAGKLEEETKMLIKQACKRAEANGRKTVMAKDL